jgi:hypothetical protein
MRHIRLLSVILNNETVQHLSHFKTSPVFESYGKMLSSLLRLSAYPTVKRLLAVGGMDLARIL